MRYFHLHRFVNLCFWLYFVSTCPCLCVFLTVSYCLCLCVCLFCLCFYPCFLSGFCFLCLFCLCLCVLSDDHLPVHFCLLHFCVNMSVSFSDCLSLFVCFCICGRGHVSPQGAVTATYHHQTNSDYRPYQHPPTTHTRG